MTPPMPKRSRKGKNLDTGTSNVGSETTTRPIPRSLANRFTNNGFSLYESKFSLRPIVVFRAIAEKDPALVGERNVFVNRGWSKIIENPAPGYVDLVREFYSNFELIDEANTIGRTFLRGKVIHITPDAIASLLQIPRVLDPVYSLHFTPPDFPSFDRIVAEICVEGFTWPSEKAAPISAIRVEFRMVAKIILANILPRVRDSETSRRHAAFLYALLTGLSIDLPTVIFSEINSNFMSIKKDGLPFASLITLFAKKAGIPLSSRTDKQDPLGEITGMTKNKSVSTSRIHASTSHAQPSQQPFVRVMPPLPPEDITLSTMYAALSNFTVDMNRAFRSIKEDIVSMKEDIAILKSRSSSSAAERVDDDDDDDDV